MVERPKDIPEELWEAPAVLDIACMPVGARELVCRATLAERKRCAKIADAVAVDREEFEGSALHPAVVAAREIAAAIRGETDGPPQG